MDAEKLRKARAALKAAHVPDDATPGMWLPGAYTGGDVAFVAMCAFIIGAVVASTSIVLLA